MSEKKELKIEELEKVNGGKSVSKNENELTWTYDLNTNVHLRSYDGGTSYYGTIKKQGKFYAYGCYSAIYYVEFPNNPENDAWFNEDSIKYMKNYMRVDEQYYPSIVVTKE